MGFIVIDYDTLVLVAVFAFAAIGLSRGWLTEFISTVLLALLSILMVNPEMLAPVLEQLNKLIKLILALLDSDFSLEPTKLMKSYEGVGNVIDVNNPYPVLLFLTVGVLVMLYAGTRISLTGEVSALSRILGAVLGAVNANIVISLIKKLILEHSDRNIKITQASLQAATGDQVTTATAAVDTVTRQAEGARMLADNGVTLALRNVPGEFLPESYWIWIGGVVVTVAVVLLISHFTERQIGTL